MTYSINSLEEVEVLKKYIKSTRTSAKSPQEAIESLTNAGIDCFVTEERTLMVKIWQVGAEDFASPEQVAIIRAKQQSPEQSDELDWLSKNLQSICQDYANQWIAINGNVIVATASDLPNLMSQITQFDKPFITFIPSDQIVWTFAYAS